jgi:photosynthetic reaction center H subunit
MIRGAIGNMDVAQIVLYAFFVFFAGLIFYLRREDRREGYPLEDEAAGRLKDPGFLLIPAPKTFRRSDGRQVSAPNFRADTRSINATKTEPWPGAPLQPNGDPMLAAVGPGSYAERADETGKTHDGHDLIVPLRVATNFAVAAESGNPIGFTVVGADRAQGGVIKDLWVDRGESIMRYYEVDTGNPGKTVLLPVTFSVVDFKRRCVVVSALRGAQFSGVPTTRDSDKVTLLEEEKIAAYYGAGTLYAMPQRVEPLL